MKGSSGKRARIVDAAYQLFNRYGFERTSMARVAATVGGSKATVYRYFPSKEELFVECVTSLCNHYLDAAFAGLRKPKADVAATLLDLGKTAPRLTCTREMVAARRLLIVQAGRSGVGRIFYGKTMQHMNELAAFLGRAMKQGQLRKADPLLAAHQLRALVEADILDRCLLDPDAPPPSPSAISRAAKSAVRLFFRIYGPATSGRGLDRRAASSDTVPSSSAYSAKAPE